MSLINIAKREISCKVVYYGIGLSGKTTNLHYIHRAVNPHDVGEMVSIDTEKGARSTSTCCRWS